MTFCFPHRLHWLFVIAAAALPWTSSIGQSTSPHPSLSGLIRSSWSIDDGLPQNTVSDILQSQNGYIWVGTREGVARFDGMRFTVFSRRTASELPSNTVTCLLEDRAGRIWIGTNAGLAFFECGRVTSVAQELAGQVIREIIEDQDSSLIVGTTRGLFRVQNGVASSMDLPGYSSAWDVRALVRHSDGSLWIGTEQSGLFRWGGRWLEHFGPASGLGGVSVNAMIQDDEGDLWVGMSGVGLRLLRDGRFLTIPLGSSQPSVSIYALHQVTSNEMWVGSSVGLLHVATRKGGFDVTALNVANGPQVWTVSALLFDRERSLWVGTLGRGLHHFAAGSFAARADLSRLDHTFVFCVFRDSRDRMWIGTDGDGVYIVSGEWNIRHLSARNGLPDNSVHTIYEDSRGTMWLGTTGGGLVEYRDGVERIYTTDTGMPNNFIRALTEDREGYLWIGTRGGLCRMSDGLTENFTAAQGLTSLFIHTLHTDRSGRVWAGTMGGGALRFDGTGFQALTTADGLPSNDVCDVYEDAEGILWLGTDGGGLVRYDGTRLAVVTTAQGLQDDAVLSIVEDDGGSFWFSSNHGLARVARADLAAFFDGGARDLEPVVYGRRDGMRSEECSRGQPSVAADRKGFLWYPTVNGVSILHPEQVRRNRFPPLVVIEMVVADGRNYLPDGGVELPPGTEEVEIQYAGLSYLSPEAVEFRYRLDGFQEEWVQAGARRAAFYTNLDPGRYVFRVNARNADGLWNETGMSIPIVVQDRFYQSRWFSVVAVLLFLGTVAVVSNIRVRRLEDRRRMLERLVRERTTELEDQMAVARDANDFKSRLLDLAAHDLKSPLISIRGFAQLLREEARGSDAGRDALEAIQRLSHSMLSLINELLDASTIEQGRIQLIRRRVDLSTLASSVVEFLKVTADRKRQRLVFVPAPPGACMVDVDIGRLQTCIENLITNGLKFSRLGSSVEIRVERWDIWARVSVRDEGPGLTEDDRRKIFGRFQKLSARPTGGEASTGLGLSIVKQIVELHGGRVTVESHPWGGTTFSLDLPPIS